jgi:excisionase family DNA binding protein
MGRNTCVPFLASIVAILSFASSSGAQGRPNPSRIEALNVKATLIRGLIKTGDLRAIQIGGRGLWRIGRQDFEDYIREAYRRTAERIIAGDFNDEGESEPG